MTSDRTATMCGMPISDVTIPGVAGPLSTSYSFWSGYRYAVAGAHVKARGILRNRLTLPGLDAPVEVKVRATLLRAYPTFVVGDRTYSAGPVTPRIQQVLAVLPVAGLLLLPSAVGLLIAIGAVAVNQSTVRSARSDGAKIGLLVATLVGVVFADLAVAVAVYSVAGS